MPRLGLIDSLATVVSLGVEESPNKIGLDTYSLDVVESSVGPEAWYSPTINLHIPTHHAADFHLNQPD